MNIVLFNIVEFLIEFFKVFLTSVFILKIDIKNKKRVIIGLSIATILVGVISKFYISDDFSFLYILILIIFIFGDFSEKKKVGMLYIAYIGISIADMMIASFVMAVFNMDVDLLFNNDWLFILLNSVSLIIITIISVIVHFRKTDKTWNMHISKKYAILLITGGLCLGMYISATLYMGFDNPQSWKTKFIAMILSIVSVVFVIIASLLIVKENRNQQLIVEIEMNRKLMEVQKDYYTTLLEKEEETRKFRHDIKNHFYCIQTLLRDKDYDELDEYLSRLNKSIANLKGGLSTGNRLVDAIVNYFGMRYPDVKICWNGKLPADIALSSMDLCTIFSNLLSNAFEAAQKTSDKWVNVSIKILESQLLITVSNKTSEEPHMVRGEFVSSKKEKNHGYGIKNARRCVEENNGQLNIIFRDKVFTAEVIFYNALTVK